MCIKQLFQSRGYVMEILVDRACGMDVHKATVVACIMGTGIKKEIRTYTTMTRTSSVVRPGSQTTGSPM